MLIDFSLKNYLSFKDEATLSMLASSSKKNPENESNLIEIENGKYKLLPFVAIYGPNASGKSNIIKGFADFRQLLLFSHRLDLDTSIPSYEPFRLDESSRREPVNFEISFAVDNVRYSLKIEIDEKKIIMEELNFFPGTKPANLYTRYLDKPIQYGSHFKGDKKSIERQLLPNHLFLSRGGNSKNPQLQTIYRYFRDNYNIHMRMDSTGIQAHETTMQLRDNNHSFKNSILELLNAADLSIVNIDFKEDKTFFDSWIKIPPDMPDDLKKDLINRFSYKPVMGHTIYSENREVIGTEYFDLNDVESSGTAKMYDIAGEVIQSLQNGSTLFIDEFNSGLHPHLNQYIIALFNDQKINRKGAQLIITTHDTCTLDLSDLRRDQVWFTDKDRYGTTELFSMDEFDKDKIRPGGKFAKWYLEGRFKAIPKLDYSKLKLWED